MQITESEQRIIHALRQLEDVQYGKVTLDCTFTRGKLAKIEVVDKTRVVLMQ